MSLSSYEQAEWDKLQSRRAAAVGRKTRHLVPRSARERASEAADAAKILPGADAAAEAYASATRELGNILGKVASSTVRSATLVKRFEAAGFDLSSIRDIHSLDLEEVDSVVKRGRIRYGHSGAAFVSGVVSGAVVTGAEVMLTGETIAGKGAKKAPELGALAAAIGMDVVSVFTLCVRTVAETAQCYGYDPGEPEEQVFMMSVLGLGAATGAQSKAAAYVELSQLTQMLFRNKGWDQLNEKVLTKVANKFASAFSVHLTKKKLGQIVPVVGMAVGGILNFAMVDKVAESADYAYRERFLVDRSGGTLSEGSAAVGRLPEGGVVEQLRTEGALPEEPPSSQPGDEL